MKKPFPKTIARWADIIEDFEHEPDDGGMWWVYLKNGWINNFTETHAIHEHTLRECALQLRHDVEPCTCDDCKLDARIDEMRAKEDKPC